VRFVQPRISLLGLAAGAMSLTAATLLLGGCAARDPYVYQADTKAAGNWRIERQLDRITGGPISSAVLVTPRVSTSKIIFPPPAQLQLLCFRQQPIVTFRFPFRIGTNRNGELGYRFDEKTGRLPKVHFVDDHKAVIIEDQAEVPLFIRQMATSKVLYVRIRALAAGRTSAEFHVEGAPAAIAAAYAACSVKAKTASAKAPVRRTAKIN
jgi:hypothetical protein